MRVNGLADTGALLACLDADDAWHSACVAALKQLSLPLGTTTAVLAELFQLVGDRPSDVRAAWQFVRSGAFTVLPITDDDLAVIERLMDRYADRPMDFADATLVRLAERENLPVMFTVDNDNFETYRFGRDRRFRVAPGRDWH